MDARANDLDILRSDFYLCLARAFMTPDAPLHEAMSAHLADELGELSDAIGYGADREVDAYRECMASIRGADELLQVYSRLFLQPPRAVHINTGVYLDGTLHGGSVQELDDWYRECGVQRAGGFPDLSDHAAVQLECASYLYAHSPAAPEAASACRVRHAPAFLGRFAARWMHAFVADLELAQRMLGMAPTPYWALARILAAAVARDAEARTDLSPAQERRERALALARHKQAAKGVTAEELDGIRQRLAERGLATDHLDRAYADRDQARGWHRMTPPAPRRT
ncbi:MAG: molecular chaperone TorD family protein [Rhodocyclaceae bacterium]|nr:molecular chaperone TorD family protein [Rhodocyclaceae bacterium]